MGFDPISIITSKLMGPIALVGCIVLALMFATTRIELAGSRHHAEALDAQINDPKTGLKTQLATCQSNEGILKGQLDDQSAKVKAVAAEMQTKVDAAVAISTKAQQGRATAEAKLMLLSSVPETGDSCKDAQAVDAKLLEGLK